MKKLFVFIIFSIFTFAAHSGVIPPVLPGQPLPSNLFVELAKNVNPTVVNISTKATPKYGLSGQMPQSMEELLEQFFGRRMPRRFSRPPQDAKPRPLSLGTGFIISEDGLIITNSHVIDKADIINVQLSEKDETLYEAEVIGKDPTTDIALIKIKTKKKLPVAKLGKSGKLQVGEWVAAFGNPFGHGHSMTKGIISAIGRDLDELNLFPFVQTDASINPGNSGGPLVNVKGEVIAVNTAIDARAQGIGFAIPIDEVKTIINQLRKNGVIERGFLGVQLADLNESAPSQLKLPSTEGALVVNVVPGEAAEKAGIKAYDFIVKYDGKKVRNSSNLSKLIKRTPKGSRKTLELIRDGRRKTLTITLGSNTPANRVAENRKSSRQSTKSSNSLLEKYGLDVSNLNKSLKKEFGIQESGKHLAVISRIVGYSKASSAGLRPGDIIYEINKSPVFNSKDVAKKLSSKGTHMLRVKRGSYFFLTQLSS